MRRLETWTPTPAHLRAVLGGAGLAAAGVLARRPDLVVVAVPLVIVAIWAAGTRPTHPAVIEHRLDHTTVPEGGATTLRATVNVEDGIEDVAMVVAAPRLVDQQPAHGQVVADAGSADAAVLGVVVRPTRWGNSRINPPLVVASSAWNGYRFASRRETNRLELTALPRATHFDAISQHVRSPGLVGANRSPRPGVGAELATVRPFQPGDRLRRIHWVETLRTDELHVTATWGDHDRQVILLIDAFEDLGTSEGLDGRASSLDVSVRAAAAVAEHSIRSGDRVGLVAMGAHGLRRVQPSAGYSHLRRILESLARVEPANVLLDDGRMPRGLKPEALILVFSPFTSDGARQRLLRISRRCADVIAIDCLPSDIAEGARDPVESIAWRIERLGRDRHLRDVRMSGLPVVAWTGAGSLDHVLQAQQRRSLTRMARR